MEESPSSWFLAGGKTSGEHEGFVVVIPPNAINNDIEDIVDESDDYTEKAMMTKEAKAFIENELDIPSARCCLWMSKELTRKIHITASNLLQKIKTKKQVPSVEIGDLRLVGTRNLKRSLGWTFVCICEHTEITISNEEETALRFLCNGYHAIENNFFMEDILENSQLTRLSRLRISS